MTELLRKEEVLKIIEDQLAEIRKGKKHCTEQCELNVRAISYRIEKLHVVYQDTK